MQYPTSRFENYGTALNALYRIQARIDAEVKPLLDEQLDLAGFEAPLAPASGHTVAELVEARMKLWRASYEYWTALGAGGCAERALREWRLFKDRHNASSTTPI